MQSEHHCERQRANLQSCFTLCRSVALSGLSRPPGRAICPLLAAAASAASAGAVFGPTAPRLLRRCRSRSRGSVAAAAAAAAALAAGMAGSEVLLSEPREPGLLPPPPPPPPREFGRPGSCPAPAATDREALRANPIPARWRAASQPIPPPRSRFCCQLCWLSFCCSCKTSARRDEEDTRRQASSL